MNNRPELAAIVERMRSDATVLERAGHERQARQLFEYADDIESSAEEWLTFLSEADAVIRSGKSRDWIASRFVAWEREGHARMKGRERQYRAAIIPRRAQIMAAHDAGREAAKRVRRTA